MYLVDTNVILEVLFDRAKANYSLAFLKLIWQGDIEGYITDYSVHSIAVVLEHKGRKHLIPDVLHSLSTFKGLTLLQATIHQMEEIARLSEKTGLDFDDAYQLFFARRMGLKVVSYDHHFDRHTSRLEPQDILQNLGLLKGGSEGEGIYPR